MTDDPQRHHVRLMVMLTKHVSAMTDRQLFQLVAAARLLVEGSDGDYLPALDAVVGELVERARASPAAPVDAIQEEFTPLIDFIVNGP